MARLVFIILFSTPCLVLAQAPDNAQVVRLEALKELIDKPKGEIRVINFWATWCAPCIKEIPLFEQLHADREDVEVFLVSMDLDLNPDPARVYQFMERRGIRANVLLLNEKDPNSWIDQIDPSWSGALPATLVVNPTTGKRIFVESQVHKDDLDKMIMEVQ